MICTLPRLVSCCISALMDRPTFTIHMLYSSSSKLHSGFYSPIHLHWYCAFSSNVLRWTLLNTYMVWHITCKLGSICLLSIFIRKIFSDLLINAIMWFSWDTDFELNRNPEFQISVPNQRKEIIAQLYNKSVQINTFDILYQLKMMSNSILQVVGHRKWGMSSYTWRAWGTGTVYQIW